MCWGGKGGGGSVVDGRGGGAREDGGKVYWFDIMVERRFIECLICMCFVSLYLHLFSAIEHVSHGKTLCS